MPTTYSTNSNLEQTVSRPVIFSIVEHLRKITMLGNDIEVRFNGKNSYRLSEGSAIEDKGRSEKAKQANFGTKRMLFVEVTEKHSEEEVMNNDAYGRMTHAYFNDEELKVQISPVYSTVEVEIEFKFRTPGKVEANRWVDDIKHRMSIYRDVNVHNVNYSYTMPMEYLVLLRSIWELRESTDGYDEDFSTYLTKHMDSSITSATDLSGDSTRIVIPEQQNRIVGLYSFTSIPDEPEKNDDTRTWEVSFSYKFTYDKPFVTRMTYPVMVHNQLLPERYIDFDLKSINYNKSNTVMDGRTSSLNYFEQSSTLNRAYGPSDYIRIPEVDDFKLNSTPDGTATIMTILCQLEKDDPRFLLNLRDLGDVTIDSDILDYIANGEHRYVTKMGTSVIFISVYQNEGLMSHDSLTVDKDLNVRLNFEPSFRLCYRLRIALFVDLGRIFPNSSITRVRKNPAVLKKFVASINEAVASHPDFSNIGRRGRVTEFEFSAMYRLLTGQGQPQGFKPGNHELDLFRGLDKNYAKKLVDNSITCKTVQSSSVIARRM